METLEEVYRRKQHRLLMVQLGLQVFSKLAWLGLACIIAFGEESYTTAQAIFFAAITWAVFNKKE